MRGAGPSGHVPYHFAEEHEHQRHQSGNLGEIYAKQLVRLGSHVVIRASALPFSFSLFLLAIFRHGLFIGIHSGLKSRNQLLDFLVALL